VTATLNQAGTQTNNYSGPLYAATSTLLRYFGISPSQISPGADVLTMRTGLTAEPRMQLARPPASPRPGQEPSPDACPASRCIANPDIQTITGLPAGTSAPNTVITAHAIRALRLHLITSGWLFQTPRPLTAAQINTARQFAATAGATIETRSGEVSLSQILSAATAVGILIALGVLAMTVGLIRSETASDLRTLTATGARPPPPPNPDGGPRGHAGPARPPHRPRHRLPHRDLLVPSRFGDRQPRARPGTRRDPGRPAARRSHRRLAVRRAPAPGDRP